MGLRLRLARLLPLAAAAALPVIASAACNAQVAAVLSSDASPDAAGGGGGASCTRDPECNDNPTISSLRGKCDNGVCVCNPDVVATPNGKCGDPTGPADDCVAKGGVCKASDLPAPPDHRPAGKGEGTCAVGACYVPLSTGKPPICVTDQQCNGDATAAPLMGTCFFGVCICKPGFSVQPNGRCDTPLPPDCTTQKGTCRQQPAECLADELSSAGQTEISCGDLIAATCCNKTATCTGPAREAAGGGYVPVAFECCKPQASPQGGSPPICVNGWQTCPEHFRAVTKPGGC